MIRPLWLATVPVMACAVASCALGSGRSYVDQVETPADARVLARDMASFVAGQIPAGSSAVILDPTPSGQAGNPLTPAFVAALRDRGFAVADAGQAHGPGTHRVRYLVTRLDNGALLRVTLDAGAAEASRFFVRNSAGRLRAGGPLAVRQIADTN